MNGQRFLKAILVATALMLAVPAGAQTVSSADIQRLQDDVYQASSDISRLRSSMRARRPGCRTSSTTCATK